MLIRRCLLPLFRLLVLTVWWFGYFLGFLVKPPKFKVAIFDWNGTIMNDLRLAYGSAVACLDRYVSCDRPRPTFDQYQNEITVQYRKFYRAYGLSDDVTDEMLCEVRNAYFAGHLNETHLNSGVIVLMKICDLLGITIAIVSGDDNVILQKNVDRFIRPHVMVAYSRGGVRKKEPVFEEIMRAEGCIPENTIHFGDSHGDQNAANYAGAYSVALFYEGSYTSKEKLEASKPKLTVSSFWEALQIFGL